MGSVGALETSSSWRDFSSAALGCGIAVDISMKMWDSVENEKCTRTRPEEGSNLSHSPRTSDVGKWGSGALGVIIHSGVLECFDSGEDVASAKQPSLAERRGGGGLFSPH